MAKKIKLTRPQLKRHRDALKRFERYLPMLKLKQQQLQLALHTIAAKRREILADVDSARDAFAPYQAVLADLAGLNIRGLAEPQQVKTSRSNIAGVNIPIFEGVTFPEAAYSLFATPAWVDRVLADLRRISALEAEADVLQQQGGLLQKELTKIVQRVNLFEKVKIPDCREAIRVIRIHLGDEMTAAVGRAKIAKGKLAAADAVPGQQAPDYQR